MTSTQARSLWRLAAAAGLVVVLYGFPLWLAPSIPLLDPDEGIHASISQEMVEGGDWICPRFIDEPFRDKPILFFWAQAASLACFGMNETAVRLPGLLFGFLGLLTTGIVTRRLFGPSAAWIAMYLQATMILPAALSQSPVHDLALVPLTNLALLAFWVADADRSRRGWWSVGSAGILLGLAALTKGLLGVALVACPALVYLALTRRLTPAICARAVAALALGTVIALPWYVAMNAHCPGYAHYFFVERHFQGYLTDTQMHGEAAWWYYLPMLLGGGLPWIAYLPIAAWDMWLRRADRASQEYRARIFVWCWLVVSVLFLSTAHSKLVTYLLPTFPAIAVLTADLWARCRAGTLTPASQHWLWRLFAGSAVSGVLVLPIVLYLTARAFQSEFTPAVWTACAVISAASCLPLWYVARRDVGGSLRTGGIALAAAFLFIMTVIVPRVAPSKSARDLAMYFNAQGELPQKLLITEERIGSFVFYLDPPLRASLTLDRLDAVRIKGLAKTPDRSPGTLVAIPERSMRRGQHYLGLTSDVPYRRAGRYRVYRARDTRSATPEIVAQKP